jgi:hypothetical protein
MSKKTHAERGLRDKTFAVSRILEQRRKRTVRQGRRLVNAKTRDGDENAR